MPIINFTQPFSIFVGVVLFVLMLFLAKENKKAWIIGTVVFAFIGLLVGHTVEFILMPNNKNCKYCNYRLTCKSIGDE